MAKLSRSTRYARWLYELLFSVHCGRLLMNRYPYVFVGVLTYLITHLLYPLAPRLGHRIHYGPYTYSVYLVVWCMLAGVLLAFLRVGGRFRSTRGLLVHITGIGAMAGLPLLFLLSFDYKTGAVLAARWSPAAAPWLWLELAVIVACVFLYLHRGQQKNAALGILVLVLHFGLWGWVVWRCNVAGLLGWVWELWRRPFWNLVEFVLLPACTSLAWGLYVRLSSAANPPAGSSGA
jgi:hypothetical protein